MTKEEQIPLIQKSPFFRPSACGHVVVASKRTATSRLDPGEPNDLIVVAEHKSSLIGCSANLMMAIVGSGIIGIPFAVSQAGLGAGVFLTCLTAIITEKSLRLLVSTAKHIHVPTYETAAEAVFGVYGFRFVLVNMFIMAFGAMVSYLILVRDSFSTVLDISPDQHGQRQAVLLVVSLGIQLPLACLRDMADLDKTSRLAVLIDIALVCYVVYAVQQYNHTSSSGSTELLDDNHTNYNNYTLEEDALAAAANNHLEDDDTHSITTMFLQDTIHWNTLFIGLGVLSFAFECQESVFLVAGSLHNPTQKRWSYVTATSLSICALLSLTVGIAGYGTFGTHTQGNILNNLVGSDNSESETVWFLSPKVAHGALGATMLCTYPLASMVARHVLVVLLFEGTLAHEGDDASILNRRDRRIGLTVGLYLLAMLPATLFQDLGIVLSLAGTVGGSCLAYIGTGMLYLGVHGGRFLELTNRSWLVLSHSKRKELLLQQQAMMMNGGSTDEDESDHRSLSLDDKHHPTMAVETAPLVSSEESAQDLISLQQRNEQSIRYLQEEEHKPVRWLQSIVWYATGFPFWCMVARIGKAGLTKHVHDLAFKSPHPIRIGDVEYTKLPITAHGRIDAECDNKAAVILVPSPHAGPWLYRQSSSFNHPALGRKKGEQSPSPRKLKFDPDIEQKLREKQEQIKQENHGSLEKDPQEKAPSWFDFGIAIFYIVFGVVAFTAGLASLYADS